MAAEDPFIYYNDNFARHVENGRRRTRPSASGEQHVHFSSEDRQPLLGNTNDDRRSTTTMLKTQASRSRKPIYANCGVNIRLNDQLPTYDAFISTPESEEVKSETSTCYKVSLQIFKIVAYILTFLIVLASALIAKSTLMFMTSQIRPGKTTPYCNELHNLDSKEAVLGLQEQAQWIWVIFFAYITPEVFTFLRSARLITFKKCDYPKLQEFLIVCLLETMHTIGVALLIFVVFPELDVIKGLMLTNCLCIIPGILLAFSRRRDNNNKMNKLIVCLIIDVLAILAQLSGLIAWPIISSKSLTYGEWAIPVALLLTSFGWWENFVEANLPPENPHEKDRNVIHIILCYFENMKKSLNEKRTRYFVYTFVSVWKMIVFFSCMVGFVHLTSGCDGKDGFFIFDYFLTTNSTRNITVRPVNSTSENQIYLNPTYTRTAESTKESYPKVDGTAAIAVWGIHIATAYLCYITSKFACRIQIQKFSYAIPITITVPMAISLLVIFCGMKDHDVCFAKKVIPLYLFWECPSENFYTNVITNEYVWIWIFWFLSQVWITFHIWVPKCKRLASTEHIFLNPMYNTMVIDQSVVLNRRRDDGEDIWMEDASVLLESGDENTTNDRALDRVPFIKACVTMWHESPVEQLGTLISLMRLDEDQAYRRLKQTYLKVVDIDFYNFEAHIFVDDAFQYSYCVKRERLVFEGLNEYTKTLIGLLNDAARKAYKAEDAHVTLGKKYVTPYGGRLKVKLFGGNYLYIHLKDKMLIRNRKRWSQVMYMYYLLGMQLNSKPIDDHRKDTIAENTFLLALDGDIEFQPKAVLLLVDLMKKNINVGAACGRIHPVGSGFIAWYQKFEYAIAHWLQKAAEHVLGCVLCSPGCFSLFRAQSLTEPNVMKTYTTRATDARHFVQYDQGEDRWLCTLLLQQGFRVEYAAASDAYTHCPESFTEFYNQRRRWVPSTVANIMDLLTSAKRTIKVNDDISIIYIIYQIFLMGSSIIGPGTIFLMVVGAMSTVFSMSNTTALWLNIVPIVIFMLACLLVKQKTQLIIAGILTCIYALLMMAVLVGIIIEMFTEGLLAPSTLSFLTFVILIALTGLLHPMEVLCLVCGLAYWVVIPSMYLLLIIYSAINMNDVTWGVRENPAINAATIAKKNLKAKKGTNKSTNFMYWLGLNTNVKEEDEDENCNINCGNLWHLTCCTHQKSKDDVVERIDKLEEKLVKILDKDTTKSISVSLRPAPEAQKPEPEKYIPKSIRCKFRRRGNNPLDTDEINSRQFYWINHEDCILEMKQEELEHSEKEAWDYIINKYLFPLTDDNLPEGKAVIENKLKKLRNQTVFAFFMINALFVVTVMLLQAHQDTINIPYPDVLHTNITWSQEDQMVTVSRNMMKISPIGFVLIVMFAGLLIIQFIAMLFHRLGTMSLILATTDLDFCSNKKDPKNKEHHLETLGTEIVEHIIASRNSSASEISQTQVTRQRNGRRNTLHTINKQRKSKKRRTTDDLEGRFVRRFTSFAVINDTNSGIENKFLKSIPRDTVEQVVERSRRYSIMQSGSHAKTEEPSNRNAIRPHSEIIKEDRDIPDPMVEIYSSDSDSSESIHELPIESELLEMNTRC